MPCPAPYRRNNQIAWVFDVRMRHLRRLELYPVWIDFFAPDGRTVPTQVPTIPIWQYMHAIFAVSKLQFQVSFVGRQGHPGLESFWENALRNDWGRSHPCLLNTTVELHLHRGFRLKVCGVAAMLPICYSVFRNLFKRKPRGRMQGRGPQGADTHQHTPGRCRNVFEL